MNVLLVDDQIRVLSGLISGLDWDTLGVTSIRTASSAAQAKSIFLETQVDILLCDIEMPRENGLSLLRWHAEPWPTHEWVYAVNNVITELYENAYCGILPFSIDRTSLGWFVYAPLGNFPQPQEVLSPLNQAYLAVSQHLPCEFAFYVSPIVPLEEINSQSALLLDAKQNNVVRESGIFCPTNRQDTLHVEKLLDTVQLRRWEGLLIDGLGSTTQDEALRYLDSLAEEGELDQRALRNFWIQFQQMAFSAIKSLQLESPQLAAAAEQGDRAASLQEIQGAVKALVSCFPKKETVSGNEKSLVEQVRKYVEDNLDQNLNVNGVAAALFMNGDYISRVFKNETGTPLKEYIIQRKMESARLLLTTTQLPVSVIASKLGYDNFSYFSQAYRRCMGVSPSEERKRK